MELGLFTAEHFQCSESVNLEYVPYLEYDRFLESCACLVSWNFTDSSYVLAMVEAVRTLKREYVAQGRHVHARRLKDQQPRPLRVIEIMICKVQD